MPLKNDTPPCTRLIIQLFAELLLNSSLDLICLQSAMWHNYVKRQILENCFIFATLLNSGRAPMFCQRSISTLVHSSLVCNTAHIPEQQSTAAVTNYFLNCFITALLLIWGLHKNKPPFGKYSNIRATRYDTCHKKLHFKNQCQCQSTISSEGNRGKLVKTHKQYKTDQHIYDLAEKNTEVVAYVIRTTAVSF